MKKVWTIERHVPYEFGEVWGVFSSKEKAIIEFKNIFNKDSIYELENFSIEEYKVDRIEEVYE